MSATRTICIFFVPVILSLVLHLRVMNTDMIGAHVWRQTQTQTVIYNFQHSDNSILHPQRFDLTRGSTSLLYEFPFYQWVIAQVNIFIGYSVLNSRIVTYLSFLLFLVGFFRVVRRFFGTHVALIINALTCFSPLLYYYCVNPLPDVFALCSAIWSLDFFFSFVSSNKKVLFFLFGISLSLAALVKLPYILFGGVFIVYIIFEKESLLKKAILALTLLIFILPVAFWYVKAVPTWENNRVALGMIENQKSLLTLLDYLQFNVISTVPELITNYASCVFLVTGIWVFIKNVKSLDHRHYYFIGLFFLFTVYFLFELNMIEKTHDYYMLPFTPLIFIVVALGVRYFLRARRSGFVVFVACISPLTAWLRIDQRWDTDSPGFTKDYMVYSDSLQKLIPFGSICVIDHDESKFIALYYLKRRGYSLFPNSLTPSTLDSLYLKGARYLVTENKNYRHGANEKVQLREIFRNDLVVHKLEPQ